MQPRFITNPARLAGARVLGLQSDDRLVALVREGHSAAFDAIVHRHRAALARYCAGIVGADRADDALQQTFVSAHRALTEQDREIDLRPWLFRIAHNNSLNILRSDRDVVSLDDPASAAIRGSAASATEVFEQNERLRETLAAVAALPRNQRDALLLRELEGRSHEEIAAALAVTPGAARQHLMRGRAAVRSAVTAITPYPLIARIATGLAGGSGGEGATAMLGGAAGISAVTVKLGAGLLATSAIVGGAVAGVPAIHHRAHRTSPVTHSVPATTPIAAHSTVPRGETHAGDDRNATSGHGHGSGSGGESSSHHGGGGSSGSSGSSGSGSSGHIGSSSGGDESSGSHSSGSGGSSGSGDSSSGSDHSSSGSDHSSSGSDHSSDSSGSSGGSGSSGSDSHTDDSVSSVPATTDDSSGGGSSDPLGDLTDGGHGGGSSDSSGDSGSSGRGEG